MENRVYSKMFMWLFVGLLITFAGGYALSLNEVLAAKVLKIGIIPIIVAELIIAILMGVRIKKMNPITAKICYLIFSVTTGITFSSIFITYKLGSIIFIFLISAIMFGALAFIGYATKKDVTKLGPILLVALISMIVVGIINIFIGSSTLELGLSILGVLIFMGYVVYDMNNIKRLINSLDEDKAAVFGAFQLYLDFINIFIRLLELFGKKKN